MASLNKVSVLKTYTVYQEFSFILPSFLSKLYQEGEAELDYDEKTLTWQEDGVKKIYRITDTHEVEEDLGDCEYEIQYIEEA